MLVIKFPYQISLFTGGSFVTKRSIKFLYNSIGSPSKPDVLPLAVFKIICLISSSDSEANKSYFCILSKNGRFILFKKGSISSFDTFSGLLNTSE